MRAAVRKFPAATFIIIKLALDFERILCYNKTVNQNRPVPADKTQRELFEEVCTMKFGIRNVGWRVYSFLPWHR